MPSPALNERMNANFRYIWKHNIDGKIYRVFSFGLILYFHTNEIRYHYTLKCLYRQKLILGFHHLYNI